MNAKSFLLTLCLFATLITAKAQEINGISVNAGNQKIVVVMDGQPMCDATSSCFIAHLVPGTYRIQVFYADEMDKHIASRKLLYYNKIKYSGKGVRHIQIDTDDKAEDGYTEQHYRNTMDQETFDAFCKTMEETSFESNKMEMLDVLPRNARFTSRQCKRIVELLTYDSNKLEMLKKLYPRVVDKEAFFIVIDALTFTSNKTEMKDFIKDFNDREGHRRR